MSISDYNKGITEIYYILKVILISKGENYMYISSTNLFIDLQSYHNNELPNWVTSEKYYNCDNFYNQLNQKKKHVWKNRINKTK